MHCYEPPAVDVLLTLGAFTYFATPAAYLNFTSARLSLYVLSDSHSIAVYYYSPQFIAVYKPEDTAILSSAYLKW
jgi:hypothetical protein